MVVFARRNGDALQDSAMLRHRAHLNDVAHRVQDVIETRFGEHASARDPRPIGRRERAHAEPRVHRRDRIDPLRYQQLLRLERAEHLIGHGDTVESAAHAVGFTDARMLRRLRAR